MTYARKKAEELRETRRAYSLTLSEIEHAILEAMAYERERCAREVEDCVIELTSPGWDEATTRAYGARANGLRNAAARIRALPPAPEESSK